MALPHPPPLPPQKKKLVARSVWCADSWFWQAAFSMAMAGSPKAKTAGLVTVPPALAALVAKWLVLWFVL